LILLLVLIWVGMPQLKMDQEYCWPLWQVL